MSIAVTIHSLAILKVWLRCKYRSGVTMMGTLTQVRGGRLHEVRAGGGAECDGRRVDVRPEPVRSALPKAVPM